MYFAQQPRHLHQRRSATMGVAWRLRAAPVSPAAATTCARRAADATQVTLARAPAAGRRLVAPIVSGVNMPLGTVDTQNDPANCGGCGLCCPPECAPPGNRFACRCGQCRDLNNCASCCMNLRHATPVFIRHAWTADGASAVVKLVGELVQRRFAHQIGRQEPLREDEIVKALARRIGSRSLPSTSLRSSSSRV